MSLPLKTVRNRNIFKRFRLRLMNGLHALGLYRGTIPQSITIANYVCTWLTIWPACPSIHWIQFSSDKVICMWFWRPLYVMGNYVQLSSLWGQKQRPTILSLITWMTVYISWKAQLQAQQFTRTYCMKKRQSQDFSFILKITTVHLLHN